MDTTQIETINIGVTRAKLEEMVGELQKALTTTEGQHGVEHTFYCKPNRRGGYEIQIIFSNDDMEADMNPDIDGSQIWVDFTSY